MIQLKHLVFFFVAMATAHLSFYKLGTYGTLPWLDLPMHVLGGVFLALVWLFVAKNYIQDVNRVVFSASLIGFVLFFGIGWEIAELIGWLYFSDVCRLCSLYDPLVGDLLLDLALDFVGAVIVVILFWPKTKEV